MYLHVFILLQQSIKVINKDLTIVLILNIFLKGINSFLKSKPPIEPDVLFICIWLVSLNQLLVLLVDYKVGAEGAFRAEYMASFVLSLIFETEWHNRLAVLRLNLDSRSLGLTSLIIVVLVVTLFINKYVLYKLLLADIISGRPVLTEATRNRRTSSTSSSTRR